MRVVSPLAKTQAGASGVRGGNTTASTNACSMEAIRVFLRETGQFVTDGAVALLRMLGDAIASLLAYCCGGHAAAHGSAVASEDVASEENAETCEAALVVAAVADEIVQFAVVGKERAFEDGKDDRDGAIAEGGAASLDVVLDQGNDGSTMPVMPVVPAVHSSLLRDPVQIARDSRNVRRTRVFVEGSEPPELPPIVKVADYRCGGGCSECSVAIDVADGLSEYERGIMPASVDVAATRELVTAVATMDETLQINAATIAYMASQLTAADGKLNKALTRLSSTRTRPIKATPVTLTATPPVPRIPSAPARLLLHAKKPRRNAARFGSRSGSDSTVAYGPASIVGT